MNEILRAYLRGVLNHDDAVEALRQFCGLSRDDALKDACRPACSDPLPCNIERPLKVEAAFRRVADPCLQYRRLLESCSASDPKGGHE